jgi:hypothetical protein
MIKSLLAPMWAKLTVATAVIVLSFGGAAFAGVLPAPLQDVVAPPAQQIGLPVPDSTGQVAATAADDDNDQGENVDNQSQEVDAASVVETPDVEAADVEAADDADEQSADESDTPEADVQSADDQGDDNDNQGDNADEQTTPEHVKAPRSSDSGDSNDSGNGDN